LGELRRLAAATAEFCRWHSLAEEVAYDLNLALEELFVNAVKHGGCEGMKNAVRIRMEPGPGDVRAEFADRGRPFDSTLVPAIGEASLEERAGGGLGIHLVRQVMRDVEYRRDGEWNRITMRRGGEAR
jgi:serine/threonine-protein kinase RsbW